MPGTGLDRAIALLRPALPDREMCSPKQDRRADHLIEAEGWIDRDRVHAVRASLRESPFKSSLRPRAPRLSFEFSGQLSKFA